MDERIFRAVFVDHIQVKIRAGDGGHGSAHFHRAKSLPKGGPDGGDGGKGGDVIFECDNAIHNLRAFFFNSKLVAPSGGNGQGSKRTGKSGKATVYKVPPGTIIYKIEEADETEAEDRLLADLPPLPTAPPTGGGEFVIHDPALPEEEEIEKAAPTRTIVADFTEIGQRETICRGGRGGKGNVHYKSSINRTPTEVQDGAPGERGRYYIELRSIADAGFVGFPNAGKSTLLRLLSAARPKVGAYPFTTLQPMIGVIDFDGYSRATIADIPGLIEGAHRNVGLGHEFLRHIMRCKLLLFMVDMAGSEGREPISDIQTLRKEISLHDDELAEYPWLIIANKMDLPDAEENLGYFKIRFPKQEIIPISADTGEGLEHLRSRLSELIGKSPD